ncbi:hypothetical protein [Streptomyces halstedii]|uniref:hypothetical protein n=1 Tax=Streptomyces halstedii TaxID=1944 RepID=UPI0036C8AFAE
MPPPVASRLYSSGYRFRVQRQAETAYPSTPVHRVQPTPEYPDRAPGRLGPVEVLPGVARVGLFDSAPLATALDGSVLAVAWFQPPEVPAGENADAAPRATPGRRWPRTTSCSDLR